MRLALLAVLVPAIAGASPLPPETVKIGPLTAEHAQTAGVLYFNRCIGGCTVTKASTDDVRTRSSTIPRGNIGEQFTLTEWRHGDQAWNELMQCLREVYSPYNVVITDQQPAPGVPYNENIVAGSDDEVNYTAGGVSPVTGDCSPFSYVISYTFANDYPPNIYTLCYVAAQETGHSYGMADHAWSFLPDGESACSDPMSYRVNCLSNGQRFFRNRAATCGDFNQTQCNCSGMNSHLKLVNALGAGESLIPAPTVSIKQPAAGATIPSGSAVIANAYSKRGVQTVELWINGYKWAQSDGAAFSATEQPPTDYSIAIPQQVPNSILDIEVVAKDDIGASTKTAVLTVTKGAPCADASTCLDGQKCEAGKCFWDPPAGEVGDECTYPQFCKSNMCVEASGGDQLCTQACVPGTVDSCPAEFDCLETAPGMGVCWPESSGGGCCSTGHGGAAQSALLAFALVILLRRRRR